MADLAALAVAAISRYQYGYGAAPATGRVDCSSLISLLIGLQLGLAIPGFKRGAYTGTTHGPVVLEYATTPLAQTVRAPGARSDLVIWPGAGPLGHIGVVLGPDEMVSALNPRRGIERTPIAGYGPPGVPHIFRRYKAAGDGGLPWNGPSSGPISVTSGPGLTGCAPTMILWPALLAVSLMRRPHDDGM